MNQLGFAFLPETATKSEDWDPMTDMAFQPKQCHCGKDYYRRGAYLFCPAGHDRFIECLGQINHPDHAAFVAYRNCIGHPIE